jgi:large subunit ribosomal protein L30
LLAVIRLRGRVAISYKINDALKLMHLHKRNHATLITDVHSNRGTLQKIKDYATWGEVNREGLDMLLRKRGRVDGNIKLTDEYVKKNLRYKSISELGKAINSLKLNIKNSGLKPVFRLHPPKGGFNKPIKKAYPKGQLGYRGEAINDLIKKMV